MMQLKMFADIQSHTGISLLPSWFRRLVIEKEKFKNLTQGSLVYITFDTRTNIIRGPGIEIEMLKTSIFPTICSSEINLNIQKVQFIDQLNPQIHVIFMQLLISIYLCIINNIV